jgi:hypothetical protein
MITPMKEYNISQNKLLEMHIEALFIMDSQLKLVSINEPWDKTRTAPRLYIGKTFDGSLIYKFRHDISLEITEQLGKYLSNEPSLDKGYGIKYINEYLAILESEKYFDEICYYYGNKINGVENGCVKVTSANIKNYKINSFKWLNDEIKYSQPCYAVIENDRMVSICRSVRITKEAHEAGIETEEGYRGKGFAKIVLMNWAKEVQDNGWVALYSTNKENRSSQMVAEKARLNKFGIGISIK